MRVVLSFLRDSCIPPPASPGASLHLLPPVPGSHTDSKELLRPKSELLCTRSQNFPQATTPKSRPARLNAWGVATHKEDLREQEIAERAKDFSAQMTQKKSA